MATRIYHPDHGYVITGDQDQINMLLDKGGVINSAIEKEEAIIDNIEPEIAEHTPRTRAKRR